MEAHEFTTPIVKEIVQPLDADPHDPFIDEFEVVVKATLKLKYDPLTIPFKRMPNL